MSWIKRKWQWAMQKKLFWCNFILLAISVVVVFVCKSPGESDFRIKTLGMILQLIGVGTVCFDLTSVARSFGKMGMIQGTLGWLKTGLTGHANAVGAMASVNLSAATSARATVRWPMDPKAEAAIRIEALEKNIGKIDEDLNAVFNTLGKHVAAAKERASKEENMRAQAVTEVRRELIEASVGNFAVLVFGAVWLAIGVVLSTLAPEIGRTVAGNWAVVWGAV